MSKIIEESINLADSKLTLQVGKLASAADISVFARLGDTCVLVTLVVGRERSDIDYLPLFVEYVEKLYAGGRIKGSRWVKREGKPSDDAVLTRRLIDRGIRPLLPKSLRREIQIIITLLSVDGVNSAEIVSAIAASAAVHLSQLPWKGPISTVRVGYVNGDDKKSGSFVINPTEEVQKYSDLDLVVTSTKEKVVMIETQAKIVSEDVVIEGIQQAVKQNQQIISFLDKLREKVGKAKIDLIEKDDVYKLKTVIKKDYAKEIQKIYEATGDRETRNSIMEDFFESMKLKFGTEFDRKKLLQAVNELEFEKIRSQIINDKKRIDGRGLDDIREIFVEASILPRTHGSAIFQRGQTQVLAIATLGAPTLEQLIEGPEGQEAKRYIHHYFMPPYSVGEVGRTGFPAPREIGHGALAEKAIEPVLPTEEEFPYVIRVVSEVLSSNGSTSMASTCGSTLALMDAGVPIKSAVAGISIGLIAEDDKKYELLTDIAGIEDYAGDMDFKIAGTADGVTAIQLDVKNDGLTNEMIKQTFAKAKVARAFILEKMKAVIQSPRGELSKYAPKVVILTPPEDKIGEIIGPGGKNIRQIIAKTACDINVTDDGKVSVSGVDKESVEKAVTLIKNVYRKFEVGEAFIGQVKRIMPFGAFVEFLPGKEGLVHVSRMGKGFVEDPSKIVKLGQDVSVKIVQTDQQGRISLTMM